ncbi:hypothetical protein llap_19182 [Limosa lapponica baueri]|uniref:Uncharacterized protein n=1 Tax=Limosa lapponica baueri TaxID=1758121 RepID=A0A2I0T9R2_LIMLA|nr:hypothetical protein llap_19182 [Limosa lapponica baueri]
MTLDSKKRDRENGTPKFGDIKLLHNPWQIGLKRHNWPLVPGSRCQPEAPGQAALLAPMLTAPVLLILRIIELPRLEGNSTKGLQHQAPVAPPGQQAAFATRMVLPPTGTTGINPPYVRRELEKPNATSKELSYDGDKGHKYQDKLKSSP